LFTHGVSAAALLSKQRFRAALTVFKSSQHKTPTQLHYFTYQSLVTAAIKVSLCAALKCLNFEPWLSNILTITWQAGEPYTALEIFRQIQAAGLIPNFITYCGLISAFGKVRRRGQPSADLAYQLWQELCDLQLPLDAAAFRTGILPSNQFIQHLHWDVLVMLHLLLLDEQSVSCSADMYVIT